jgi:hypothetical protein
MGLMAVAIRLALRGSRVTWLGADVPVVDLLSAVEEIGPDLVGVAVIQPTARAPLVAAAHRVREAAPKGARVVFGGDGLPEAIPPVEGVEWVRDAQELLS